MKPRRILAVARKEALHVRRDPFSLAMAAAIPMLLLLLFGFVLTLDVDSVPLAVRDESGTPESRELVSRFGGSRYFRIVSYPADARGLSDALASGEAFAALVVPSDFARRVAAGRPAALQFLVDGSDANTATIAKGYAEAVAAGYGEAIAARAARARGLRPPRPTLDVRPRVWFNTDLESKNFIVPGLIAIIMMVIAALLTSLTVAREWEQGTMEQLIATPVTGPELILGKLLPYFAIGMVDMALAVGMGELLFHVPLRGSVALLFGVAALFLAGALALGILISAGARTQLVASQIAIIVTFLPSFLLSGFMFSIGNMPPAIRAVTRIFPARYFVAALKGIYLKGSGARTLWPEIALLAAFAAAMLLLATRAFRKKLV